MGAYIEITNSLANQWGDAMWPIIWQSAVLAGVIYLLTLCLRRLPATVRFWLWMLVPLRLLVMPLITVSLPLLPAPTQLETANIEPVSAEMVITEPPVVRGIETAPVAEEFEPVSVTMEKEYLVSTRVWPNVWSLLMWAWIVGIAFWSIRLIRGWCRIRHIASSAVEVSEDKVLALAQNAATMLGLRRIPRILVTEESVSPFLFGVLQPVLVIPADLVSKVCDEALLAVCAHEFVHLRRRDPLVGWILAICEVIYFFHPVFYFVKQRILFERERACDDWVIATSKAKRSIYANALISAADVCRTFNAKMGPVGVVAESFGELKKRLVAIGSNLRPRARLSMTALILLVIIGVICMPGIVLTARPMTSAEGEAAQAVKGAGELASTGKVVDNDGRPIPKAKVVLYYNYSKWGLGNRIMEETRSTPDGSFIFERPLTYSSTTGYPYGRDSYVILATHPDYALGWHKIIRYQELPRYEIILTKPKSQTITVTDHAGNPLPGARVWPYSIGNRTDPNSLFRDYLSLPTDAGIVGGTTDTNGQAVVTNLPRTRCSFYTTLRGYAHGLSFSGKKNIRLSKGSTVSGLVLNEESKPVEGALVRFHTNWMWQFFLAQTDSQGRFQFEDLPAKGWDRSPWGKSEGADGSYKISIEHNDYIAPETQDQFQPGEVIEDFIIDAYRGTLVKCRVVDANTNSPVVGARIQGSNESGRIDGYSDVNGIFTVRVMSGQASLFFGSPPDGVYVLRGQNPPESHLRFDAQGKEMTVTLKSPPIAGRLTSVRGKVHFPDGNPAGDVKISTTNLAAYETLTFGGTGGAYTATNRDGSFELTGVPTGLKLFLYGHTKDHQYILAQIIDSVEDPTELSTPLIMKYGQVADVLLTDKQNKPCTNMSLKIKPVMWGNQLFRSEYHRGQTDAEGRFKINGIIPGMEYFIIDSRANLGESGWWDKYYNETVVLIPSIGDGDGRKSDVVFAQQEEAHRSKQKTVLQVEGKKFTTTLVHQPLLKFEGIDIKFSAEQSKGKMLLLCFWDMNQRPSRRLIMELAKREKELEEKSVVALLVHTSDVDVQKPQRFLKSYKIPFTCGSIKNDTEKVLFRWGVRAQPWLVLTNEKGVVRAGGFGLEQLGEKLREKNSPQTSSEQGSTKSNKIVLKLIDSDGRPVGGAKVGTNVRSRDVSVLGTKLSWNLRGREHNISNEWGEITLTREKLFTPSWSADRKLALYVLHEDRRIGATCMISKDGEREEINLPLEPVCHVHGKLDSEGLKKIGRPLTWANVYLSWDRDSFGVLSHMPDNKRFEFFVPPGRYTLNAYGSGEGASTERANPTFEVKANQPELDLGIIDLPPTKVTSLIGKPAPELGPIKAWKNGTPVKLTDLYGKLVILHFGGGYPSTSRDLPRLVELHEEFENAGLVIISLYNCESMKQLEERFAEASKKFGGEPDVPFRSAVDGGKGRPIEGTDRTIPGDTYAAYDISIYPTIVLINREGKIAEKLNLSGAKKKLENMLGVTVKPALPTWRQRFNRVYFLEEGQVLKRIAPPFISERKEYYKQEHSSQASSIERAPDFFTFHWDSGLKNWGLGFGSGKRPLKSVLNSNLSMNQNSYEGPEELLEIDVPGDWIVRKDASEEQKLKALEEILVKEIGRDIRFEKRTIERQAIVATGSFNYHRLPVVQDDRWIHMFSDDFAPDGGGGGGTADSVSEFLQAIGNRVGMPVIDQTESSEEIRIPYRHHRSAYLSRIEDPTEKAKKLQLLLDNLSRQTNLQFTVTRWPVEIWFVTDENKEK